MITISLSTDPSARDVHVATAIIDGRTFTAQHSKKSPIPMLARKLTAEGIHPSRLTEVVRGSTHVLSKPLSLSRWTGKDVFDDKNVGLITRAYRPFTKLPKAD